MSFRRVLVANRGEIACRVMRTLRVLGVSPAAVYSTADKDAPHVALADVAAEIGPAPAVESYLDVAAVVAAAERLGCDAVHPGYGFLSENAGFARACAAAGLAFIGPPVEALEAMGDKAAARRLATAAGVPPVPGYEGADDDATLVEQAGRVGFPLLVKAAMGGGGKGMRLVEQADALPDALAAARREARAAFGDGTLILERYVHPARHVEVQVFGDAHGTVVALGERECSLQRRHQKVVEEAPSTAVDASLRARFGEAACRLAARVGYVGAGTVEFLLGADGGFHFLEMNTRLQVEHGVTELVTGLDLVAWQVRVAAGERLPWSATPELRGHAIEVRIYAEDPSTGFLPQTGVLGDVRWPEGPGVRVDAGVRGGQEVSPHYDPMLAKLMAWGEDRETARLRLLTALRETRLTGLATNLGYLADVLAGPAFQTGATFTHTLEADGVPKLELPQEVLWLAAAALSSGARTRARAVGRDGAPDLPGPFEELGAFRIVPPGEGS